MLSTSVIKNVGQASHYFAAKDNYYTKEEGEEKSEWFGKGAEKLNLSGSVDPEQFTALLRGTMPDGQQVGKILDNKKGEVLHRAGWDLTFSAPKSVSILALVGGDQRLIEAHRNAVAVALTEVENSCAEVRIKGKDGMKFHNTKNIIAALWHHDLSREQDPQLHTHSVVMNLTERHDGKWRSLASQLGRYDKETTNEVHGFIERVRNNKRYFGKIYEAELAYQIKELGYEIQKNDKTSVFEIAGVPREIIEHFSKRRLEIEKQMQEKGLSGGKAADVVTLRTREPKKDIDRDTLVQLWQEKGKSLGLDCASLIEQSFETKTSISAEVKNNLSQLDLTPALEVLNKAAKDLSVFKNSFTMEELIDEASTYAIQEKINVKDLLAAVDKAVETGELLSLASPSGKTFLMAKESLENEKSIVDNIQNAKQLQEKVAEFKIDNYFAQHSEYKKIQVDLIKDILGTDRYVLLEGQATKDELLKPLVEVMKSANLKVEIIGASQIAAKNLSKELKSNPITLFDHLKELFIDTSIKNQSVLQFMNKEESSPDVLFVENTNLLSTIQLKDIIEWGKDKGTKILFLGNKTLLTSQQQYFSLEKLTENGMKLFKIAEEKNNKSAMLDEKMIPALVENIGDRLIEAKDEVRLALMTAHFTKLSADERKDTYLTTNNKKNVEQLNTLVHHRLKQDEKLGKSFYLEIFSPAFISQEKANLATSYLVGNVVRFSEHIPTLSIKGGDYLAIISHDIKSNNVILQKKDGSQIVWNPDKKITGRNGIVECFWVKNQEFNINEQIIFNRSVPMQKISKGERFTIHSAFMNKLKLEKKDGKFIIIDVNKNNHRHFDYGYAGTLHSINHEKLDKVIADLPLGSFQVDQRRFFQAISQAKETWVYTDKAQGFATLIEKKTGDRINAHEALEKSNDIKKNLHAFYNLVENEIAKKSDGKVYNVSRVAVDSIEYAFKHLSERDAGFTHKELMQTAMTHALGSVSIKELKEISKTLKDSGILLQGNRQDGTLWTTVEAVRLEREILALSIVDKGKFQPIASLDTVHAVTGKSNLKPEQIDAIKEIMQSTDRVLTIQGRAGTGKTTLLATASEVLTTHNLLKQEGYELRGLAPTNTAVNKMKERGIPAQTIHSFVIDMKNLQASGQPIPNFSQTILVTDEASMASNRKMHEVLKTTHDYNFRMVIPMGDTRQLASIEAGKPQALIQSQVEPIKLEEITRQNTENLKQAVKETYVFKFDKAFETLKDSIIEVALTSEQKQSIKNGYRGAAYSENRLERLNMLVNDYMGYSLADRENTQIITPGHNDREITNELIRERLKEEGTLKPGEDKSFAILRPESFSEIERTRVTNYKIGHVLRFNQSQNKSIIASEYYTVSQIHPKQNVLIINDQSGREILWEVPKHQDGKSLAVEVFTSKERQLQVGDVIRWSRTDKEKQLFSSEKAKVLSVNGHQITVERANQEPFTFNGNDSKFQHWDHGYASTVYAVQGDTKQIVLAHFESYREKLVTQAAFLVALTRATDVFKIYTDNTTDLLKQIKENNGAKLSALEVIGEFPKVKEARSKALIEPSNQQLTDDGRGAQNRSISDPKGLKYNAPLFDKYTISRIQEGLNKDAEQIAVEFLGKPKLKGNNFLKFGSNNGSLVVTTKGLKQGFWNDFSEMRGGANMLSFIQKFGNMDRKQALEYAASRLGIYTGNQEKLSQFDYQKIQKIAQEKQQQQAKEIAKINANMVKFSKKLATQSRPIGGTIVEKYLKDHRGIVMENYPEDIRYHPGVYSRLNGKTLPAMLAIARDTKGNITGVQTTYLDEKSANKIGMDQVKIQKQSFGIMKGSSVSFGQNSSKEVLIAEGVETGLSLVKALPQASVKVTLSLSNFLNVEHKNTPDKIVFCLDNDGKNIKENKVIQNASTRLILKGSEISFMLPTALGDSKQDYNDIIRKQGIEPIQQDYRKAISFSQFYGKDLENLLTQHTKSLEKPNDKVPNLSEKKVHTTPKMKENSLSKQPSQDREINL